MDQFTLPDLAQFFEFHNRTEGKSPKTIRWYNEMLDRLGRYLQDERASPRITDIGSQRCGPSSTISSTRPSGVTRRTHA